MNTSNHHLMMQQQQPPGQGYFLIFDNSNLFLSLYFAWYVIFKLVEAKE
jgi:hypothetical protein